MWWVYCAGSGICPLTFLVDEDIIAPGALIVENLGRLTGRMILQTGLGLGQERGRRMISEGESKCMK